MTPQEREILEEQRWRLLNSFGWGPFHDGLVQQRIDAIDRRLSKLTSTQAGVSGHDQPKELRF